MQTSDYLSVIALIISAISLFLSWRQYARDAGRLKLHIDYTSEMCGGTFCLEITNIGRRPVMVDKVAVLTFDEKEFPVSENRFILDESEPKK